MNINGVELVYKFILYIYIFIYLFIYIYNSGNNKIKICC